MQSSSNDEGFTFICRLIGGGGGGGGSELKNKKKYQRSTKTKHKHPARMNFMLPLGESMVTRRIKVAYMRLLEESEEAALIPKEVADEPSEEDPFARAWTNDHDAWLFDDGLRLRAIFEGGNWVESRRSTTPIRDFPWSKVCREEEKEIKTNLHQMDNSFFCAAEPLTKEYDLQYIHLLASCRP